MTNPEVSCDECPVRTKQEEKKLASKSMAENQRQRLIIMSNFPLINIGIHDLYGSTGFQTASTRRISQENT